MEISLLLVLTSRFLLIGLNFLNSIFFVALLASLIFFITRGMPFQPQAFLGALSMMNLILLFYFVSVFIADLNHISVYLPYSVYFIENTLIERALK